MLDTETICSVGSGSDDSGPPSLQNELDNVQTMERAAETDTLHHINQATSPQSETSPVVPNPPMGKNFELRLIGWHICYYMYFLYMTSFFVFIYIKLNSLPNNVKISKNITSFALLHC